MESKVNYARIGLFVVLLGTALIAVILWLGKRESRRAYDFYDVYVRESVTGLNVNAAVKYMGVNVGFVKEMAVDPEDPQRVRLTLSVARGTPVKEDTVAFLEFQGLTGVAIVNLTSSRRESPPLVAQPGERYPVIKNVPSVYARLDQAFDQILNNRSLPDLVTNLNQLAVNTQSLVDKENRAAFSRLLTEMAKMAGTLDRMTAKVDAQLPAVLNHLQETSAMLENLVRHNQAGIEAFTGQTLTESGLLVSELRQLTATAKRLATQLERQPNALLFGKSERPRGPGE